MNLKKTILAVMARDDLKAAIQAAGLDEADRRSVQSMRKALSMSRRVKPIHLLDAMPEAQVKQVCERVGIDPTGRKNALIQRLLNGKPTTAAEDAPTGDHARSAEVLAQPTPVPFQPPAKISVTRRNWSGPASTTRMAPCGRCPE